MATKEDLVGIHVPWPVADRLGFTNLAVTCAGTNSAGATAITSKACTLTAASSQTGARLPNTPGDFFFITNSSSTTAIVYPPTGGTMNGGSTDAGVNLAQNHAAIFWIPASLIAVSIPATP